jgi:hypothetical protein
MKKTLLNKALTMYIALTSSLVFPVLTSAANLQVPSMGIKTITEAMMRSRAGDTVWVDNGVYREHVLLAPGVTLIARSAFKAEINGGGRGTVVTMAKNSSISGFIIKNGTIGVFSNSAGNSISSCRIIKNWQTGIIVVRHLPKVEDNVIAFNRGSGIQGWDVRGTSATINHNTISYNGNHGVAVGGSSEMIMENNVIAFNERFGLKILADEEKIKVTNNNFYRNLNSFHALPTGNFSFDPAFISPRSNMNFRSNPAQCCKAKGTDDQELGARISY